METESRRISSCWNLFQHIHQGYLPRTEVRLAYHLMKRLSCILTSSIDLMSKSSIICLLFSVLKHVSIYDRINVAALLDVHWLTIKRYVQPRGVIHIINIDTQDEDSHIDEDNCYPVLCRPRKSWRRRRRRSVAPLYPYECLLIQYNEMDEDKAASLPRFNSSYQRTSDPTIIFDSFWLSFPAPDLAWTIMYQLYLLMLCHTLILLRCIAINVESFALCGD